MKAYIVQVPSDSPNLLQTDLEFYEKFSFKSLSDKTNEIAQIYNLPFKLTENYFPWNRTFEIGLVGDFKPTTSQPRECQDFITKKLKHQVLEYTN